VRVNNKDINYHTLKSIDRKCYIQRITVLFFVIYWFTKAIKCTFTDLKPFLLMLAC